MQHEAKIELIDNCPIPGATRIVDECYRYTDADQIGEGTYGKVGRTCRCCQPVYSFPTHPYWFMAQQAALSSCFIQHAEGYCLPCCMLGMKRCTRELTAKARRLL
jgi:hypothetical protein